MKTEVKVLMGFLLLGLLIASTSFFFAHSTNERLVKIGLTHSEHLGMAQSLKSKTMGAIQESLAYVLSGEEIEKREYFDWDNNFALSIKEFIDFITLHNMGAKEEKILITKIISQQKKLSKNAKEMFNEYEEKGSISSKIFHDYEASIDELEAGLQVLTKNAQTEVNHAQTFINDEIRSNKIKIYALGTLTLVFCLVFGYFLYFHIKRGNRLREENENLLNIMANNTTSVIYMKDIEGRYLLINKRYEDLFNLRNQDLQGKTDLDLFPKEIADNFIKNDRNVIESGKPFEGEEIAPHKDGLHTYISIKVPLRNPEGTIYGICGISTDITERKKAENLSARMGRILDSSFNEIYIFDAENYKFIQANYGARRNLNYSIEEITQLTPIDIKPEYTQEAFKKLIKPLIDKQQTMVVFETMHKRKNETLYPVSVRLQLMHNESPPVFLAIINDISKRKQALEEIINESKFTSENPFPTMRVSIEGKFIYLNKSADKIGRKSNWKIDHPIPPTWQKKLNKAFLSKEMIEFEDEIEGKTYNFYMVPILDRNYLNIYGLDITSRKKAESELETFASIASHDLQAPLRKISLFGDRLKESAKNLDERSREYILRMQNSAKQMSLFIEDMLNFSAISAEQIPFEKIDLQERIKEICEELNHLILSEKGKINFSSLPEVEGNRIQIDQLFINLITNSLKYKQDDNTPIINIYPVSNEYGFCEIHIEDNGIGFEEKYVDKIFEPFQRLHIISKIKGTGLGLSICKKIMDRHNGTIYAKSILGKGTTFIIKFPVKQKK